MRAWLAAMGTRLRRRNRKRCGCDICTDSGEKRRGRLYRCRVCLRFVPWCFGAHDVVGEVCDDCYAPSLRAICALHPEAS